jgi:hypothetical protein
VRRSLAPGLGRGILLGGGWVWGVAFDCFENASKSWTLLELGHILVCRPSTGWGFNC